MRALVTGLYDLSFARMSKSHRQTATIMMGLICAGSSTQHPNTQAQARMRKHLGGLLAFLHDRVT